jgi:hypothetical protein
MQVNVAAQRRVSRTHRLSLAVWGYTKDVEADGQMRASNHGKLLSPKEMMVATNRSTS